MKKFVLYLKGSSKPIIISDEDNNQEHIIEEIEKIFLADKIYTFKTENDILIGRPSELQAVLVMNCDKNDNIDTNINGKKLENIVKTENITSIKTKESEKKNINKESVELQPEKTKQNITKENEKITNSNKKIMTLDEVKKKLKDNSDKLNNFIVTQATTKENNE
jgi:hypothetical protein